MEEKALLNLAKEYGVVFDDVGELESSEHDNAVMNYYTVQYRRRVAKKLMYYFIVSHEPSRSQ